MAEPSGNVKSDVILQVGQPPVALKAAEYLKNVGYSGDITESVEKSTARTFNADWQSGGLTEPEAVDLLDEYLDATIRAKGVQALRDL